VQVTEKLGVSGLVSGAEGRDGFRPPSAWLVAYANDVERAEFEWQLLVEIEAAFRRQADGKVLFPFRRVFGVGAPAA
jgi:trans-aconitate methyltransferase